MKAETHPLYEKLKNFPLDFAQATFPFSRRLRLENGWTEDYTRRVLLEYRRFLFLAAVSDNPVAPPDAVDQAWHLHMVYTRSYWDELCGEILGFPLHHGPTRGGQAEADKFTDWYVRTLESYRVWFGEMPPADIWLPVPEKLQKERNRFQRVNTSQNWVIPKRLPRFAPGVALLAVLGCLPFVFGASGTDGVYAALFLILVLALFVFLVVRSPRQPGGVNGTIGGGSGGDATVFVDAGGGDSNDGHSHGHGDSGGGSDSGGSDGGSSGCGGGGCGGGD
ncbi:MAG: hypothetical protein H8F28_16935 [Fibrella sp.]|nr:hypothetical protein [Armatimonadota bacterium]